MVMICDLNTKHGLVSTGTIDLPWIDVKSEAFSAVPCRPLPSQVAAIALVATTVGTTSATEEIATSRRASCS